MQEYIRTWDKLKMKVRRVHPGQIWIDTEYKTIIIRHIKLYNIMIRLYKSIRKENALQEYIFI